MCLYLFMLVHNSVCYFDAYLDLFYSSNIRIICPKFTFIAVFVRKME